MSDTGKGWATPEHGIEFTFKTTDTPIQSIRNYLLKYVRKSFYILTSKFPDKDDNNKMTAGRHVFNALVWKYGWRLIQKLRGLSQIMRYRRPDTADECQAVEISLQNQEPINKAKNANILPCGLRRSKI